MTLQVKSTAKRKPLSTWELASLLQPLHSHQRRTWKIARVRDQFLPILSFVYRIRFVTSQQVRRKFPQSLKSDRICRRHLAEMEELGWLSVMPARGTSPLWPKVFQTTTRGINQL